MSKSDSVAMVTKVALVTGGSKRVGKCISETLHEEGFNIVIHCNSSVLEAKELSEKLNRKREGSTYVVALDLSLNVATTCKKLVEESASKWGRLDLLVNNASNFIKTSLDSLTEEEWDLCLDVNLKAPVFLMQAASKYLKSVEGCIINLTDMLSERPQKTLFSHSISKKGLVGATQNAALCLAPEIRVNSISPGCVMWPDVNAEFKKKYLETTPLKRCGTPEDVANLVVFLASSKSKFITGQDISLDGGKQLA